MIKAEQHQKYIPLTAPVTEVVKRLSVSLDATPDDKLGLVYTACVRLDKSAMNIDGTQVNLVPGMAVSVEIKTGQRRLIEYVLSPFIQHVSESVRER